MISLFLDTSSAYLRMAVLKDHKTLNSFEEKLDKDLSRVALSLLKKMLDEVNLKPIDIDNFYVVEGPGSFTGLRVGVTIAKTFCHFLNKDLFPVSSLCLMASSKENNYIVPIIDARRGFVYAGIYDNSLKVILKDQYILFTSLLNILKKYDNYVLIGNEKYEFANNEIALKYNYVKYLTNVKTKPVAARLFVPNYLKRTEAEERLNHD